uniref:Odorant receptor n=1 Tax=Holotrichia parallela TaxID=93412 RepID=A0AA49X6T7_HOLPA|nr:odorant receptor 43a [Holotrichia parallela]
MPAGKTTKSGLRKLSFEFSKDVYKDGVKMCILPGKVLLQGVCCWPDDEGLRMKIVGWFLFWNLFVIEIFHASYVCLNIKDIGDAVDAGATVTTTMEGLVRLHIMLTKRDVINSTLVKIWKQFWSLDVIEPVKRRKLKRQAQMAVMLTSIFLGSSIISNSQITGMPFVRNRGLVLKSVFPFDWRRYYVYEIIYAWQYYSDWFVLFMINAFDFFFIALVIICSVQYVIMQEIFKYILTSESKRHRKIIFGESGETMTDREMLFECLEQHKLLIGICNELEESFNIAILIQFFVSTSAICAASLVLKLDYSQFLKMLMYAAAHLSQLFYYCYAGHELSYETGRLSDAIYHCNWHLTYDRDFRKAIVLMIQRSQRVQCLTAGGITELDFASFLKIMRLSFSFYTLLNNLLTKHIN